MQKPVTAGGKLSPGRPLWPPAPQPNIYHPKAHRGAFWDRTSPSGPGDGPVTQAHLWPGTVEVVLGEGEPRGRVLIEVDAEPR